MTSGHHNSLKQFIKLKFIGKIFNVTVGLRRLTHDSGEKFAYQEINQKFREVKEVVAARENFVKIPVKSLGDFVGGNSKNDQQTLGLFVRAATLSALMLTTKAASYFGITTLAATILRC